MKRKGSVTVFLSLTLAVILALSGACLEYARVQVLAYQTQAAAASAEESVFASYCGPLYERYQLLARVVPDGDPDGLSDEAKVYTEAYGNPGNGAVNFARFATKDLQWSSLALATDENGAVFSEMAAEALLASEGEVLLEDWLKRLGLKDSETADTLEKNAGKGEIKSTDVLSDYGDLKDDLKKAEEEAGEETKSEEEKGGSGASKKNSKEGKKILKLLESIGKVLDRGVLGLVVPADREISDGKVQGEDFPSSLSSKTKSRSVRGSSASKGSAVLLREYLMRNLSSFASAEDEEEGAAYELEYVIAGRKTDKANLRSVVCRILWMRMGLNMTYLLKCPSKMKEIQTAALLAAGWTGQPLLVQAVQALLLSAWAFAESVCDVRTLLAGGKEPLIKDDAGWKLSFDSLVEKPESFETDSKGEEKGLAYEDYLRICLYFMKSKTAAYRGMDVIQWNMRELGESDFRFADCAVSAELALTVQAAPVFSFLAGGMVKSPGSYTFTKKSSFSLLER